jgi:hypothetical protein
MKFENMPNILQIPIVTISDLLSAEMTKLYTSHNISVSSNITGKLY